MNTDTDVNSGPGSDSSSLSDLPDHDHNELECPACIMIQEEINLLFDDRDKFVQESVKKHEECLAAIEKYEECHAELMKVKAESDERGFRIAQLSRDYNDDECRASLAEERAKSADLQKALNNQSEMMWQMKEESNNRLVEVEGMNVDEYVAQVLEEVQPQWQRECLEKYEKVLKEKLDEQNAEHQKALDGVTVMLAKEKSEHQGRTTEVEWCRAQLDEMKAKARQDMDYAAEQQKEIDDLKAKLTLEKSEHMESVKLAEFYKTRLDEFSTNAQSTTAMNSTKEHTDEVSALQGKLNDAMNIVKQMEFQAQSLLRQRSDAENRATTAENSITVLTTAGIDLEGQYNQAMLRIDNLYQHVENLNGTIQSRDSEIAQLQSQNTAYAAVQVQEATAHLQASIAQAESELSGKAIEEAEQLTKLTRLTDEIASLKRELAGKLIKEAKLETTLTCLTEEVAALKDLTNSVHDRASFEDAYLREQCLRIEAVHEKVAAERQLEEAKREIADIRSRYSTPAATRTLSRAVKDKKAQVEEQAKMIADLRVKIKSMERGAEGADDDAAEGTRKVNSHGSKRQRLLERQGREDRAGFQPVHDPLTAQPDRSRFNRKPGRPEYPAETPSIISRLALHLPSDTRDLVGGNLHAQDPASAGPEVPVIIVGENADTPGVEAGVVGGDLHEQDPALAGPEVPGDIAKSQSLVPSFWEAVRFSLGYSLFLSLLLAAFSRGS